ncbi:arylamine N-acetyltransferase [Streptomyces bambusae]|uniref:arylamine N-acetyltransferase family protein n=1 Tax=Streptomyces bambusae TaxID=1550616 RepID=UPI001CFDF315|nr:arylamine N-acetyltransferase [Streptomyces bambusae]MCB5166862.1 arylamine N-acetyltransferase [Streptomyces bambusae]
MDETTELLPPEHVAAYLARIGAERPLRPTAEALRELHLRHLQAVPFENLSIHLGEDVSLDAGALFDKLVTARRGGFCFELNGAFALLLRSLGYRVDLLAAEVTPAGGGTTIPAGHLALRVESCEGTAWLADVGFGDHSHFPLAFDDRGDQKDPGGVFRLADAPEGDLDVFQNDEVQFRLELRPRPLSHFRSAAWWHCTSPLSNFTRGPVCTRLTPDGRTTLTGRTLITTTPAGRTKQVLHDTPALLTTYQDHFGVVLDRAPVPLLPRD